MPFQKAFAATALMQLAQLCVGQNVMRPATVYYIEDLPADIQADFPSELTAAKDQVYIRRDVAVLEGATLTCQDKGQVTLGIDNSSAYQLEGRAWGQFMGHPIVVPHDYAGASGCPELANHTLFGPKAAVPQEVLQEMDQVDDFAIMVPVEVISVTDDALSVRVIWVDYHALFASVGIAPPGLEWLNHGVYPWTNVGSNLEQSNPSPKGGAEAINDFALTKLWGHVD